MLFYSPKSELALDSDIQTMRSLYDVLEEHGSFMDYVETTYEAQLSYYESLYDYDEAWQPPCAGSAPFCEVPPLAEEFHGVSDDASSQPDEDMYSVWPDDDPELHNH